MNVISSLGSELLKYSEYVRISFKKMLAYRVSYMIGVITYIIHVAVYYFLYQSLYHKHDSINGYTLQEMLTYISLGWISKSLYLNYIDREITEDIQSGQVAMDLIKPIDFQLMYFARGIGHSLFRFVLFTPPIVVFTFILFSTSGPASGFHLAAFSVASFFSILIYLAINYIIGLLAIFFLSLRGILYSKNLIIELLSGLLLPIDWFPNWFQFLSGLLPFQAIAYYPLQIYLGRIHGQFIFFSLLSQLTWLAIIFLVGRFVWIVCQRRILIQGG